MEKRGNVKEIDKQDLAVKIVKEYFEEIFKVDDICIINLVIKPTVFFECLNIYIIGTIVLNESDYHGFFANVSFVNDIPNFLDVVFDDMEKKKKFGTVKFI